MQKLIFFVRVGILCLLVVIFSSAAGTVDSVAPNYVVIGAFAFQQNAVSFTSQARTRSLNARFDLNPNRKLFYVYVMTTGSRPEAIREALRIRKETRYADAWVY